MEPNDIEKPLINTKDLALVLWQKGFLRTPHRLFIIGYALLILIGAFLLWLPFSHTPGRVDFLEALFTSASAVCVTGLTVVDTGSVFTGFGQIVLLVLMQVGGLAIMGFAALLFIALGRRLSTPSPAPRQELYFHPEILARFRKTFFSILTMTLTIELAGALCLFWLFLPRMRFSTALFSAVFYSVSAFCNAGFTLVRDSLMSERGHLFVMLVLLLLVFLGGLGYPVLLEFKGRIYRRLFPNREEASERLSTHARLVLFVSALLLAAGFVGLLLFGQTPTETGWLSKAGNALFQTVTARSAGFSTINIGALPMASMFLLILLMFIGGSPGSCAGGVKTTSLALWFGDLRSLFSSREEVVFFGRTVPLLQVYWALVLVTLAILWNLAGTLILLGTESHTPGADIGKILFEQISAFSTAGLSTGLTHKLTFAGKLWILLTMFVGRLGPLAFLSWVMSSERKDRDHPPEEPVMIG